LVRKYKLYYKLFCVHNLFDIIEWNNVTIVLEYIFINHYYFGQVWPILQTKIMKHTKWFNDIYLWFSQFRFSKTLIQSTNLGPIMVIKLFSCVTEVLISVNKLEININYLFLCMCSVELFFSIAIFTILLK